jgi:hypothetical protein
MKAHTKDRNLTLITNENAVFWTGYMVRIKSSILLASLTCQDSVKREYPACIFLL